MRILAATFYDFCHRYALNMSLAKSSDTTYVSHNMHSQTSKFVNFNVLLTLNLSIILVINQLNAQILVL